MAAMEARSCIDQLRFPSMKIDIFGLQDIARRLQLHANNSLCLICFGCCSFFFCFPTRRCFLFCFDDCGSFLKWDFLRVPWAARAYIVQLMCRDRSRYSLNVLIPLFIIFYYCFIIFVYVFLFFRNVSFERPGMCIIFMSLLFVEIQNGRTISFIYIVTDISLFICYFHFSRCVPFEKSGDQHWRGMCIIFACLVIRGNGELLKNSFIFIMGEHDYDLLMLSDENVVVTAMRIGDYV